MRCSATVVWRVDGSVMTPECFGHLLFETCRAASSLRTLLQQYFSDEDVTYTCSDCGKVDAPARLRHRIYRLPRVAILHIKRFGIDMAAQEIRKRHDLVSFMETLDLGMKGTYAPLG